MSCRGESISFPIIWDEEDGYELRARETPPSVRPHPFSIFFISDLRTEKLAIYGVESLALVCC